MELETDTAPVVISGAGPTGLMLASELCLAGVTPIVLERLPQASAIPKGNGLYGQIVPVLDYRGLLEPMRAGTTYSGPVPRWAFGPLQLDLARLGTSPLHVLAMPQRKVEERLAERLATLGGTVRREHQLRSFSQHDDHVLLEVNGPDGDYQLRASYLAGCDGARSAVRKQAGIEFPGVTSADISRIGRVRLPATMIVASTGEVEVPGAGRLQPGAMKMAAGGRISIMPLAALDSGAEPGIYIVATFEEDPDVDPDTPMTTGELAASVQRVLGAELPMTDPQWLTRTIGNSRIAQAFLAGRILLAGDAAHLAGAGGSLNAGLMDAINLGWKLAARVQGRAPGGLLDSYHAERHAAARRTQLVTRAQRALGASGEYADALRELVGELLTYSEPLRHVGELIEGSAVRYDVADGKPQHALAGLLAPDLALATADGPTRVAELVRAGRPLLVDLTPDGRAGAAAAALSVRVPVIEASSVTAPAPADAILIRPDAIVAWASGPAAADPAAGLAEAVSRWCPQAD
jgi:2-polyprenyl-6-methoxyphenol hydroxylase-like FAD-dependent oxidoreductase